MTSFPSTPPRRPHRAVLLAFVAATLVAACRAPSPLAKAAPYDFDARATPAPAAFSSEQDLLASWSDGGVGGLRAFWDSGEAGQFSGVGGVPIAYRIHRAANPKAAVVLVPGRTEAIVKYAEVARDLVAQGYSTYAVTLRGQGEAGRMLADPQKGYVDFFEDYVADTHQFITAVVKPESARVFMLAHSTGGAVGLLVVDEHPDDLAAIATTSPMLDIDLGSYPPPVAATLAAGFCDATDGTGYTLGAGPYQAETDFAKDGVTHSLARAEWKTRQIAEDPALQLGGVTWRWLCQALEGSSRALTSAAYSSTPTLVLQAGQDTVVHAGAEATYCSHAPRCTLTTFAEGKHELLQEQDAVRNVAMSRIVKFFDGQVTP